MYQDAAVIHIGIIALAALALIWGGVSDALRFRIPNGATVALIVLFPAYAYTSPENIAWGQNLLSFAILLSVGFFMFSRNLAGAGDVKLLAAAGLWAGVESMAVLLFITAVAGGLLGLVMAGLAWNRNRSHPPDKKVSLKKVPIPYGVAIAIGGLASLMQLSSPVLFSS